MQDLDLLFNELKKIYVSLKKNPNRIFSKENLNEKDLNRHKITQEYLLLFKEKELNIEDEESLLKLKLNKNEFIKLAFELEKIIKIFYDKLLNMALSTEKVIDLFSKIFPNEYDGNPLKLDQTIKILNVLKETITDAANQPQLISLIKLKLVSKASDAIANENLNIDQIILALQKSCCGQSSRQIVTSLENTVCFDKKMYITEIQNFSQRLQTSYINEGVRRDTAINYVITDISKNIKKNFIQNPVMVSAMNQNFTSVDEVIHRFESVHIDRESSLNTFRQTNLNFRGRGDHRGNSKRNNNFNSNNHNNFNRNSHNKSYNKYFQNRENSRGHYQNNYYSKGRNQNNQNHSFKVQNIETKAQENSLGPHQI